MAYFERIKDVVSSPFSPEIIRQRTAAGWQMVSIEWRRELPDGEAPVEGVFGEDIPYGLRISDDCSRRRCADHRECLRRRRLQQALHHREVRDATRSTPSAIRPQSAAG